MRYSLRQIDVFLAVAEEGSFSRASARLEVEQATVSAIVRTLEVGLGRRLFERSRGRKPELTADGRLLLDQARGFREQAASVAEAFKPSTSGTETELALGGTPMVVELWLKPAVIRLQEMNPELSISVHTAPKAELETLLQDGRVDAIAALDRNSSSTDAIVRFLEVGLYVSPAHPLAQDAARLEDCGFILPPRGSAAEALVLASLERAGLKSIKAAARAQFSASLISLTCSGAGVGYLFDDQAQPFYASGQLLKLNYPLPAVALRLFTSAKVSDSTRHSLIALLGASAPSR